MQTGKENQTNGLLPVVHRAEQVLVGSRIVAEFLGVGHKDWLGNTISTHLLAIEDNFGKVCFENTPSGLTNQPLRYALLTEDQALFVATLSRNTPQVVAFKAALVKTFQKIRNTQAVAYGAYDFLGQRVRYADIDGERWTYARDLLRAYGVKRPRIKPHAFQSYSRKMQLLGVQGEVWCVNTKGAEIITLPRMNYIQLSLAFNAETAHPQTPAL